MYFRFEVDENNFDRCPLFRFMRIFPGILFRNSKISNTYILFVILIIIDLKMRSNKDVFSLLFMNILIKFVKI